MGLVGLFGGLFLIPLQTILQERPPEDDVGDALGTANILTFVGVLVASAAYMILIGWLDFNAPALMGLLGSITVITGFGLVLGLPHFLLRSIGWILRQGYEVKISGEENLPLVGPGLLVVDQERPIDTYLFIGVFSRFLRYLDSAHVRNLPGVSLLVNPVNPEEITPDERAAGGWYHEDEYLYWAPENFADSIRKEEEKWESIKNFARTRNHPTRGRWRT